MDLAKLGRSAAGMVVLSLLACSAGPAAAQAVHRCRTNEGYAFQDRPCAANQDAGMHVIRATPAGDVPPGVKSQQEYAAAHDTPPPSQFFAVENGGPRSAPPPQAAQKGYRCEAGKRTWFQYEPCPALGHDGEHSVYRFADGRATRSGDFTYVPTVEVTMQHMRPTTQKEVTRRQACEGQRAELDPYTRYTTDNPCANMK